MNVEDLSDEQILERLTSKEIKELALWAFKEGNFDHMLRDRI